MNTKKHISLSRIVLWVVLSVILVSYIYPIVFSLFTSMKNDQEFYSSIWGLPSHLRIENYIGAFFVGHIGDYFMNSVITTVLTLFFLEIIALLMAYALARMKIPHTEAILFALLIIQVLPTESTIIPLYVMMSKLHITASPYMTMVLAYVGWGIPGTAIIYKNYFDSIPSELLESARIDGSGELTTLVKIILPLMKSAVATCLVFNFTFVWGELMWAQISTLTTDAGIPLTVGLLNFQGTYATNWPMLSAAIIMVVIPLIVIFLFLQKYLISGLTAGSVKG